MNTNKTPQLNLSLVSEIHYDQDLSNLNYEENDFSLMKFNSNNNSNNNNDDDESKRRFSMDNDDRSWKRSRNDNDNNDNNNNNNNNSTPSDEKSRDILIPINSYHITNTPLSSIDNNDISNENFQVDLNLNSSLRSDSQTSQDINKNSQLNDDVVNNNTLK